MQIRISVSFAIGKFEHGQQVVQQKNGWPVQFEVMTDARASLLKWPKLRGGSLKDFAFPSRTDHPAHLAPGRMLTLPMNG
jgi:hypothetical protein